MLCTTAMISRARLWGSTALVTSTNTLPSNSRSRWTAAASAVATLLGASLISLPGHASAEDVNLNTQNPLLDISTLGDQTIGSLSGASGTSVVLGGNRLTTNSPQNTTFAGVISGSGGLTKGGTGTLNLTGINTYRGHTIVDGGTLSIGAGGSIAASSGITLSSGARFDITDATSPLTIRSLSGATGSQVVLGNNTLNINLDIDTTFSGVISGSGGITTTGDGVLRLIGNQTYTGLTIIRDGDLYIGDTGRPGSISSDIVAQGIYSSIFFRNPQHYTYSGIISGAGRLFLESGGTLILNKPHTYTGMTSLASSSLKIVGDGSIAASEALYISGHGSPYFDISEASNPQFINNIYGARGSSILLGNNRLTINQNQYSNYEGIISGSGGLTLTGIDTLHLRGANTYTGDTIIQRGTLAISQDGSLSNATALILSGTAKFDISGATTSQAIGHLTGTSSTGVVLGDNNLTVNQTNNTTFAGILSGNGGLFKNGTGTLTLTGANTYTGGTTINAGTLQIGDSISTGSVTGNIVNNANLIFNPSNDIIYSGVISGYGSLYKAGSGKLILTGANTYTGLTSINGGRLEIGAGGSLANTIQVSVDGTAVFDIANAGSAQTIGNLSGGSSSAVSLGANSLILNQTSDTNFRGSIYGTGNLFKNGTGKLILTGNNSFSGITTINAGTLQLGNGGMSGSVAGNIINNATLAFNRSDGFIYGGVVSGSGNLIQNGSSILYLTNNNTYTGDTIINSGSVFLGYSSAAGSVAGNIQNYSLLYFDRTIDTDYSHVISGTGNLNKNQASTLRLTGANTYTGLTIINNGTIALVAGGSLSASSGINLKNTARFDIEASDGPQSIGNLVGTSSTSVALGNNNLTVNQTTSDTFAGVISGTGDLVKNGAGTLTLTGANTYTGDTTINEGTLQFGGSTGSVSGNIINNATLSFRHSDSITFGNVISGTGTLHKNGAETLTLTGANTYTGGTVILGGTLAIGAGGSVAESSDFLIFSKAKFDISNADAPQTIKTLMGLAESEILLGANTLTVQQNLSSSFEGLISGTGRLNKNGTAALVLTGDNTFSGVTNVNAGTLIIRGKHAGTATVTGGNLQFGDATGGQNSILNSITVSGYGSALGFYGQGTATVSGAVDLQDNTTLSILAATNTPALTADTMTIGNGTTFNLSGIGAATQLPLTLFSTTNGITGNFTNITIGGYTGAVDYMTISAHKSADGLSYLVSPSLSWSAGNNLSHGTFTLADASNSFALDVALGDQAANSATLWNGTSLTKAGAGTLILSADNTYTGGTTISGGTLQLGNQTATGSVIGNIYNNGTLWIDRTGNHIFANTVSGTGNLIYSGGGTLTLTGINSYSGPTTILSGTLSVAQNDNLGAANGAVTINGGALQISGTTFETMNRSVALGNNGGAIDIADEAHTLTLASALTGGDLTKRGEGTLTLSGSNTYGNTLIEAGTLLGALDTIRGNISIAKDATLSLNQIGTGFHSNLFSGLGSIALNGNGTTLIASDNAGFLGQTFLNAGTLILGNPQFAGTLGGSLNVASGATLGGSGTIGSGAGSVITIASGATLSPGNSIGALTVNGDLILSSGSFLNMELGSAESELNNLSTNDRINVTGNLTLDGTLNLSQSLSSDDGSVGFGYYRLATYGGSLIDNGLNIGTTPTLNGADYQILTATAGSVDLFIAAIGDKSLQHWQGGNGTWSDSNKPWINQDGQVAVAWGANHAVFRNQPGGFNGGTITVEGPQSFEGLQFVNEGFSLIGSGSLVTTAEGSEIRVLAANATIATAITGAGSITKTQGGTLTLSGTNTYSGGTIISGGTLSVSQNANLGDASGTLELNGGALRITGTDFSTMDRDVTIGANGGVIDIADATHSLSLTSTIAGGSLIKRGLGTLSLTGENTYGHTSIEAGKLSGSLSSIRGNIHVGTNAILDLNQSANLTYNGAFSGAGEIVLNGNGTTLLGANSSGFAGNTFLNAGTLLVGNDYHVGHLGGSLNVASGATLGGSGIIGSGTGSLITIASGATLSPGNSIGTLTVNGDLKFEDRARYVVEVNPLNTNSDKLIVTGTATLNGGTVVHIGATGEYNPRSTYTILDASTLTGEFGAVTSDFAFLNPNLVYNYAAGTVELELLRNNIEFASIAQTRNQVSTATAIESIGFGAGHAVYDTVVQLRDDAIEIRRSFDQLSGELHSTVRAIQLEDSRLIRNAANDRLRAAFGQSAGADTPVMAYTSSGAQVAVDATYEGPAFWVQSHGSWGDFDGQPGVASIDRQIGGIMLGADRKLGTWRVGALAGYSQTNMHAKGRNAVAANSTLGVFGGNQWGKASLRLAMAQTWHEVETKRSVSMTGLSDYLQADYDSSTRQAFAEADYALVSREHTRVDAFANAAQVRVHSLAFSEHGDEAALDGAKAENEVIFTTLGLRGTRQFELGSTTALLRGSAGWRNASGDLAAKGIHAFSAGDEFIVAGAPVAKDAAVIETGMDARFNARTTFALTYTGQFSDTGQDHGFNARLSLTF